MASSQLQSRIGWVSGWRRRGAPQRWLICSSAAKTNKLIQYFYYEMPLRVIEYCGIINKWPGCTHTHTRTALSLCLCVCVCAWVIIPAINGIIIQRRIYATIHQKLSAYLSEFFRFYSKCVLCLHDVCCVCVCGVCVCGVCGLGN